MEYSSNIRMVIASASSKLCKEMQAYVNETEGFQCVGIATNGVECIDVIGKIRPDAVLADYFMPHKDALGLLEEVFASNISPDTDFFIFSSVRDSGLAGRAMRAGAKYFFMWPHNKKDLLKRISDIKKESGQILFKDGDTIQHWNQTVKKEIPYKSMEEVITFIIHKIGLAPNLKGYQYIRHGVLLALQEPHLISSVTKQLYPDIAKYFNTTPARVERDIRHCIASSWKKNGGKVYNQMFEYDENHKRPTNSEFIAGVSEYIRILQA